MTAPRTPCRRNMILLTALFASAYHYVYITSALSIVRYRIKLHKNHYVGRRLSLHATTDQNDNECTSAINNTNIDRRVFLLQTCIIGSTLSLSPQLSYAATRDTKTGILLPSVGEIESAIPTTYDEDDNPLNGDITTSFARLDSSPDNIFYAEPRFVEHVDEQAVKSMTTYISDRFLQHGDSVLDLCSSWTSHIRQPNALQLTRVAGLGMNEKELEANPSLTEWTVMDLNANRNFKLPYDDESFDKIILQLSIDYLIFPVEVMKEASRVLKKNGQIAIIFSNRLFLSKAIGLWTGSDDVDHAYTVGSYLHFGGFTEIKAEDLSTRKQKGKEQVIVGDPLYVVTGMKS